jgi:hypothetical protein
MARAARKASIFDDIVVFAKVAERLEESSQSLRAIAGELGTSDYLLRTAIQRVQDHLGGAPLINTAERMASATALTDEGKRFYTEEIRRLVDRRPTPRTEVRLAISHSLLTWQFLTAALADFQAVSQCHIDLHARVEMDFNQVVRDLQTDKLDAAVLWSTESRREVYPGIDAHAIPKKFAVVLIGTDPAEIEAYSQAIEQAQAVEKSKGDRMREALRDLSGRRVVSLRADNQPAVSFLPQPDRAGGGERIEVDTVDAVIACVRAKIADFGLVVANYPMLDLLKRAGQLFFTDPPIGRDACLLGLTSRKSNTETRRLIRFISRSLDALPDRPSHASRALEPAFPQEPEFYEQLAFDYYIDEPRGAERDVRDSLSRPRIAASWKWAEVLLRREPASKKAEALAQHEGKGRGKEVRLSFQGTIRNLFDDQFKCQAERIASNLFYVRALPSEGQDQKASVGSFVSVFTGCHKSGKDGYIYGQWSGTNPRDNAPTVYSTIWSWRPLPLEKLREIANHVRVRTVLDADEGLDFDRQPAGRAAYGPR